VSARPLEGTWHDCLSPFERWGDQYDWFFNADESKCVVREIYADSDAVLTHLGSVGDLLAQIIDVGGGIEIEVFGDPSDALLEATEALQPSIYSYFQGK
jgi:hypothetical protein